MGAPAYEVILRAQAEGRKANNRRRRKAADAHLGEWSRGTRRDGRASKLLPADVLADAAAEGLVSSDRWDKHLTPAARD